MLVPNARWGNEVGFASGTELWFSFQVFSSFFYFVFLHSPILVHMFDHDWIIALHKYKLPFCISGITVQVGNMWNPWQWQGFSWEKCKSKHWDGSKGIPSLPNGLQGYEMRHLIQVVPMYKSDQVMGNDICLHTVVVVHASLVPCRDITDISIKPYLWKSRPSVLPEPEK